MCFGMEAQKTIAVIKQTPLPEAIDTVTNTVEGVVQGVTSGTTCCIGSFSSSRIKLKLLYKRDNSSAQPRRPGRTTLL